MKRHFLQQAKVFNEAKHGVIGQLMSEKLDGMRAFWDGGVSRGHAALDVPWANTEKDKKIVYATGLWSRYGKVIHAPDWWLDKLPLIPLDGELFTGRGKFQQTMSFCRKHTPVYSEWEQVQFMVFDSPCLSNVLYDSHIKQGSYDKQLVGCKEWIETYGGEWNHTDPKIPFQESYAMFDEHTHLSSICQPIKQIQVLSHEQYSDFVAEVAMLNGEGVILRSPSASYIAERPDHITKIKPFLDAEAEVIGYVTGRETDRGSKLLGMMGALVVKYNNRIFKLSGFTDRERSLTNTSRGQTDNYEDATLWAYAHPETSCPDWIEATYFPRGSFVTFLYRELSDEGIPKDARYFRKYTT